MIIYAADDTLIADIPPDDKSYRYRENISDYNIVLYFSYAGYLDVPVNSYIIYEDEKWELLSPQNFTKKGERNYDYTLILDGAPGILKKYKMRDTTSGKVKFSLTATPKVHIQMIVDNLNAREGQSGWTVGEVIDTDEIVISYSLNSLYEALSTIADECDTEFEITSNKGLHLRKTEYNKDNPLPLSYGKGNGFKTGIKRENNSDDERAIELLYVQGGERNINASTYGSQTLLLPKAQTLEYEGKTYITDESGLYLKRADKESITGEEGALDCSDIYPQRVGTISKVECEDEEDNFYNFFDSSIPSELNYEDCIISGETMTVIFQSGILTGKEFDVAYDHDTKKFEIVPQEIDGVTMPNATWIPEVGDTYAVFGISLPDAYVCNNNSQEGASWDMFREGCKYLYENEIPKFNFSGDIDSKWLRENWLIYGGKLVVGGYVRFSDPQFEDGVDIRIKSIKDYINKKYKVEVELTNITTGASFSTQMSKIDQNVVRTEELNKQTLSYTKRRFRDATDTSKLLQEAFDYFGEAINPVVIQTMQMIVGDESLQFRFVDGTSSAATVVHNVTYNDGCLTSPCGVIRHMTLGISSISSTHSEYKEWQLPDYTSSSLDKDKAYYLYAKVSKNNDDGIFITSTTAIALEEVDDYYHLLVGILNKADETGERSYVELYGYTEILPGRITTDKIVSSDGNTFFDLANSIIKGTISFLNSNGEYKNVSELNDETNTFIEETYASDKENLETQLDGKIETFYQKTAPSVEWSATVIKQQHVGDMWYNTSTKELKRYNSNYVWETIEDKTAISAYTAASAAQDTADGKRRVFVNTPAVPYDVGDLWLTGGSEDGQLKRCVTAKSADEAYSSNDWVVATHYDNTKTQIDGGIVTSGTVQLAGDDASIKAGVTGAGTADNSVRMWAGASAGNKATAPFRVLQDGSVVMTKASVEGEINATSGTFKGELNGVTGSFKSLNCVNSSGDVVAQLIFGSNGRIWVYGDMQQQGYNTEEGRSYRFYASDLWCRGTFGRKSCNTIYVKNTKAYYYVNGLYKTEKVEITLSSGTTSGGDTYYKIPLYGATDDASGFAVDLAVINNTESLKYLLVGSLGKKVTVVNANNNVTVYFYANGDKVEMSGGRVRDYIYINGFIAPTLASGVLGAGWMRGAEYDNNWG